MKFSLVELHEMAQKTDKGVARVVYLARKETNVSSDLMNRLFFLVKDLKEKNWASVDARLKEMIGDERIWDENDISNVAAGNIDRLQSSLTYRLPGKEAFYGFSQHKLLTIFGSIRTFWEIKPSDHKGLATFLDDGIKKIRAVTETIPAKLKAKAA